MLIRSTTLWVALLGVGLNLAVSSTLWADATRVAEPIVTAPFSGLRDLAGQVIPAEGDAGVQIGQGHWTLVMIWATDCVVCKQQKPGLSAFHDAWSAHGAQVIGIALDGPENLDAVQAYLAEYRVSFPNYVGRFLTVAADYQALTGESLFGTPTYLMFDPDGVLKGNNPGPLAEGAIERFIRRHQTRATHASPAAELVELPATH